MTMEWKACVMSKLYFGAKLSNWDMIDFVGIPNLWESHDGLPWKLCIFT